MAIAYPFGLSSVLMTKTRTQVASFMQYHPRSGAAYTKHTSTDNPVFFNVTFRFRQVDAQRFFAWFKSALQEGRLPFTVPIRTEFGLANQEVRFYAAQGDTILDHSQEGGVHTYTGTVFASSLSYPEGIENNWDFVASPFWQYRGEWDLALNSITPVTNFIELNFASRMYVKNEYMVNLDEVLSLSRASAGTDFVGGVLTDFGVDEPRVGDGGLLVERRSENLITNSNSIPTGWLTNGSTITPRQADTSVGVNAKLTPSTLSESHICRPPTHGVNVGFVTFSAILKKDGYSRVQIACDGTAQWQGGTQPFARFDIENGIVTGGSANSIAAIKKINDDWFECSLIVQCVSNSTSRISIWVINQNGTSASFAGDGVSGVLISLPQDEPGEGRTSFIDSGNNSDRQSDQATIDISDISEKSGSYLIEFDNDGIAYGRCIASAYTDSQNSINAYISQSGQIVMIATKSGFSQSVFVSGTPVVGGCRVGVSYSDASATISVNGVSQSISGDWSNEMQTVALGMDDHGEMHLNSHISYFKFNPESAAESELNQWTGA